MSAVGMDVAVLAHAAPAADQSIGVSGACLWLVEGVGAKALGGALGQAARARPGSLWEWLDAAMAAPGLAAGPCAGACLKVEREGFEASVFGEAALAIANESAPGVVRVWQDDKLRALLSKTRRGFRGLLASGQGVAGALSLAEPALERCAMLADRPGGWASLSASGRGLARACLGRETVPKSALVALASTAMARAVASDESPLSWDDVLSEPAARLREAQEGPAEASVHASGPCFLRVALSCRRGP